jgi:predicted acetyltransferase
MHIEILRAGPQNKQVLENLMHLYLYDFSEYTGDDTDEQGRFIDEYLERYWTEENRYPFQVQVDGKPAGFVLVRDMTGEDGQPVHSIAEFFILKKFRRKRIGQQAAWHIFNQFPGSWHVAEIEENLPAQEFWRQVIGEYTGGAYLEVRQPDWEGPIQTFQSLNSGG